MAEKKPKISDTEWWLVIGFLFTMDATMFLLDFTGIGEFLDPFIDGFIGMAYPFYLHIRGQDVTNNKRLAGLIVTFLTGLFSDGVLDFWFLDGYYNMRLAKAEEKEAENTASNTSNGQQIDRKMATRTNQNNVTPINSRQNYSPAMYDRFNQEQREKMNLTSPMPGSKSSGGGYERFNREQNEKMGLTQAMPGARSGNKAGDPFHRGGIDDNHDFTGGGEKVIMPTRGSKKPKSYEDVREEERKHYEEWDKQKAA